MKSSRKTYVAVVVALIVLCVLGVLLPRILSMRAVRQAVLRRINRQSAVALEVDDWALRWRGGLRFVGVRVETGDGQTAFKAKEITSTRGLLDLLPQSKDLGTVRLVEPDWRFTVAGPLSAKPGEAEVPASPERAPEAPAPRVPAREGGPAEGASGRRLPDIKVALTVSNGRILVASPQSETPLALQNLNVEVGVAGLDAPVTFTVTGVQPSREGAKAAAEGRLEASGSVLVFRQGVLALARTEGEVELSLHAIDAAPFAAVAAAYVVLPHIEGSVDGKARLMLGSGGDLGVVTDLAASHVQLSGGPLGDDSPRFERVVLDGDVLFAGGKVAFKRLVVDAPLGHVQIAGEFEMGGATALPSGKVSGEVNLDLAELARAFPGTLKVREGLAVTAGSARLEGEAVAGAEGLQVTALLRIRDLAALKGDQTVALESPISILVRGRRSGEGIVLDALKAEGSFGGIQGEGSLEHIRVTADLDVGKAMAEAAKFVDLGEQGLQGRIKATLSAERKAESHEIKVNAVWTDLDYKRQSLRIREPEVVLDVEALLTGDDVAFHSLDLTSRPLSVSCSGRLTDWPKAKRLELSGTMKPDFALLAGLGLFPLKVPLTLSGSRQGPFKLRTELGCADKHQQLLQSAVETDLHLARLKVLGIDAHNVDLNLHLDEGTLQAGIRAQVNDGVLSASPVLHLQGPSPVLVFAERTQLLKDVKLTGEMMSEIMTLVSPILRTSSVVTGSVDLAVEPCRLTLNDTFKKEATFSGEVSFTNVVLTPAGSLVELLDLLHVEARDVAISNQTITVTCASGWVQSSPLQLVCDGHRLGLSGSVGLDGRLRYMASLPLTRKLVGDIGYEKLKGIDLKLPIGGTIAKPEISKKAFLSLLADQIKDHLPEVEDLIKENVPKVLDRGQELLNKLFEKLDDKSSGGE